MSEVMNAIGDRLVHRLCQVALILFFIELQPLKSDQLLNTHLVVVE